VLENWKRGTALESNWGKCCSEGILVLLLKPAFQELQFQGEDKEMVDVCFSEILQRAKAIQTAFVHVEQEKEMIVLWVNALQNGSFPAIAKLIAAFSLLMENYRNLQALKGRPMIPNFESRVALALRNRRPDEIMRIFTSQMTA
jgi:hypothetical protein